MKGMLLGFVALTLALLPMAPVSAATPEPVPAVADGVQDSYAHGWYVHYHSDHSDHRGHAHHRIAGPFHTRHDAEDHAHHLRHDGFHIDRIVCN